jgi:hypothetical protein
MPRPRPASRQRIGRRRKSNLIALQRRQNIRPNFITRLRPVHASSLSAILKKEAASMELHFTRELEARLTESAAKQGRNVEDVALDILARYFEEEERFVEAVKLGEDALAQGDYLTHEQVRERLSRFLQP